MLSDNFGAPAPWENRTNRALALALVLVLALLLWRGNEMWDHLAGAPRGDELLFCASGQGDLPGIERALDQGADINARGMGDMTPIMVACDNGGSIASVQLLLDRGADPKLVAMAGVTALYNAMMADNPELIDLLVRSGANPNQEINGETLLDFAIRLGRPNAAKALGAHGGHTNVNSTTFARSF